MGFFSRWLKKSPVSVAQKFSESPVNISQVAQLPIDWFGAGVYDREAAVRTVIDHIARNIASMPFKVYTRQPDGDRVEDTTSPLAQLMAKPSVLPGMTRYRFFYSLLCDGLLNDRWLCLLDADKQSGRLWLRRIPVQNFTLSGNTLDEITGVQISTGQPEGSQYFKLPDPQILLDVGYSTSGIGGSPVSGTLASEGDAVAVAGGAGRIRAGHAQLQGWRQSRRWLAAAQRRHGNQDSGRVQADRHAGH